MINSLTGVGLNLYPMKYYIMLGRYCSKLPLKVQVEKLREGGHLIVSSEHIFYRFTKIMNHDKMVLGKGDGITVSCRTIHPSKQIRKKYPDMERGKRLKIRLFCAKK